MESNYRDGPAGHKKMINFLIFLIFYKCFDQMWLNEETRIAQVLILTSSPGPTALHPLRRMR